MKEKILQSVNGAIQAATQLTKPHALNFIDEAAKLIADCYRNGNKIILAGNGGSLCDANHFSEELVAKFRDERPALPAICLSESGYLTAAGNDFGFEKVFARGVEAFGCSGDIFIGLTTSGNSPNMIHAFAAAKKKNLKTIAFLGRGGGKLKGCADLELIIDGFTYSDRVQEAHMAAIHIIIEIMEEHLFYSEANKSPILEEILSTLESR